MRGYALALLLFVPLASAGGVHDGPEAVTTTMYIHHTDGGLALNPTTPGIPVLAPAAIGLACGEPAVWTARFARNASDVSWDPLARVAAFDATAPRLTWYMESVQPGTGEPMPRPPLPMIVSAQLVGGDPNGLVLAQGSTDEVASVTGDRHVMRADIVMAWADKAATSLPLDGFSLRVTAAMADPSECGAAPVGLRAYADGDHHSGILWDLYEPVRLDLFEVGWAGETLVIRVHASSPWGAFDVAAPRAPVVTTPNGASVSPALTMLEDDGTQAATWAWQAGDVVNGTYRVDVAAASADGSFEVDAFTTFRVGGDAPAVAPATPAPGRSTPGFALPLALLGIALARRISF